MTMQRGVRTRIRPVACRNGGRDHRVRLPNEMELGQVCYRVRHDRGIQRTGQGADVGQPVQEHMIQIAGNGSQAGHVFPPGCHQGRNGNAT